MRWYPLPGRFYGWPSAPGPCGSPGILDKPAGRLCRVFFGRAGCRTSLARTVSHRDVGNPEKVLHRDRREVIVDHIDDQVLIALLRLEIQLMETGLRLTSSMFSGFSGMSSSSPPAFPRYIPVTIATGSRGSSVSNGIPPGIVRAHPGVFELLDDLIKPAGLSGK